MSAQPQLAMTVETTDLLAAEARFRAARNEFLNARMELRSACTSQRQRKLIMLLRQDLANKEIAARLGISESVVKFHGESLLAKLGVESRRDI
jgi:DNA-binding CsgD family transcriptional regulator